MYSNWALTGVILGLLALLMFIIQMQSKQINRAHKRDFDLMNLWMYLSMLSSTTEDDAELGAILRRLIKEGSENKALQAHLQKIKKENR